MTTNHWEPCRLGAIIEVKHGFAFQSEFFREEPPGDILLTPGNFAIGGGFQGEKLKYYIGPVPEEFVLSKDDLLITMTDLSKTSDTLGFPALVLASSGSRYLHNQRLGRVLIRDGALVEKKYLYYLLRSQPYRNEILASATGTTVKHTSPGRITAFNFLLPPLPTQRAIARILGALDDKIALNRRQSATLEALARAVFQSWFMDFDPVRARAAGRAPVAMDAATAALFPDAFDVVEGREVPRGWRTAPIGDVTRVVGGSTPSTTEPEFWEGGMHYWATPKDLSSLSAIPLLETERRITDAGLSQISSGLLPKGTVLLSSRAPVGYTAITDVPVAINQGFIAMVCDRELPNHYVFWWTRMNMEEIKSRANGTIFLEISKANFRPLTVLAPPTPVLRAFVKVVEPLYQKVRANLQQSRTLAALRDALLPRLLSGELRVRAAERLVKERV